MLKMDLICRTCLAYADDMESIRNKQLIGTEYTEVCSMILLCTGLEISENDKFANSICSNCLESVKNAFKYRKKCWESQTILEETSKILEDVPNDDDGFSAFIGNHQEIDTFQDLEISVKGSPELQNEQLKIVCKTTKNQNISRSDAAIHKQTGLIKKPQYIDICDSTQIDALIAVTPKNHKRYKNMDKFIKIMENDTPTALKLYCCTLCNETYESVSPLRKHLLIKHNIQVLKSFECETCAKTFVNEKYYNQHMDSHNQTEPVIGRHICQFCGKHYKFESTLRDHIRRHNGDKHLKCDLCDFRTISSYELKVHMRSHTGEKPYVCHICGAGYKSSSHRGAHIKATHFEGRPYECIICLKNYKSQQLYRRHMEIHNPKNVIKCEICMREFNYRKTLLVHMKQHGEQRFKCTVCEKAFYQKQPCQLHMKKVHNVVMEKA